MNVKKLREILATYPENTELYLYGLYGVMPLGTAEEIKFKEDSTTGLVFDYNR